MIELKVEEYCQECKAFSPVADINMLMNSPKFEECTDEDEPAFMRTIVRCENARRCAGIARHIRRELNMRERSDDILNEEKLKNESENQNND